MSDSDSSQKFSPIQVQLEAGKQYYWCRCGLSKSQPFCDGSHKDTGVTPLAFTSEESKSAWLCVCKKTGNAPFCDGTHNKL
jgi:CDGSH iron-sulfur domain-containing protein 3